MTAASSARATSLLHVGRNSLKAFDDSAGARSTAPSSEASALARAASRRVLVLTSRGAVEGCAFDVESATTGGGTSDEGVVIPTAGDVSVTKTPAITSNRRLLAGKKGHIDQ
jgi:hypothetical protein